MVTRGGREVPRPEAAPPGRDAALAAELSSALRSLNAARSERCRLVDAAAMIPRGAPPAASRAVEALLGALAGRLARTSPTPKGASCSTSTSRLSSDRSAGGHPGAPARRAASPGPSPALCDRSRAPTAPTGSAPRWRRCRAPCRLRAGRRGRTPAPHRPPGRGPAARWVPPGAGVRVGIDTGPIGPRLMRPSGAGPPSRRRRGRACPPAACGRGRAGALRGCARGSSDARVSGPRRRLWGVNLSGRRVALLRDGPELIALPSFGMPPSFGPQHPPRSWRRGQAPVPSRAPVARPSGGAAPSGSRGPGRLPDEPLAARRGALGR